MGETAASVLLVRLVDPNLGLIILSKVGAGSNLVVRGRDSGPKGPEFESSYEIRLTLKMGTLFWYQCPNCDIAVLV